MNICIISSLFIVIDDDAGRQFLRINLVFLKLRQKVTPATTALNQVVLPFSTHKTGRSLQVLLLGWQGIQQYDTEVVSNVATVTANFPQILVNTFKSLKVGNTDRQTDRQISEHARKHAHTQHGKPIGIISFLMEGTLLNKGQRQEATNQFPSQALAKYYAVNDYSVTASNRSNRAL